MIFSVEYTDTFGGEANYAWCKRVELDLPDTVKDRTLVRKAKEALGLTGVPCRREELGGETIALYPRGSNTVVFITPDL